MPRMLAASSLLLAALVVAGRPVPAGSAGSTGPIGAIGAIGATREELDTKLMSLGASFGQTIYEVFYDKAEAAANYPLLAVLAEMARMQVAQQRREQDALALASQLVDRYFGAGGSSHLRTHDSLPKTKSLADLIVSRCVQNACEAEFVAEQIRRKRIYAMLTEHAEAAGVRDVAAEYAVRVHDRKARAVKARERTELALRRYQRDIMDDATGGLGSPVMKSVDELIALSKVSRRAADRSARAGQIDFDRTPIVLDLAKVERKLVGRVNRWTNFAVERVPMDQVLAFEREQRRAYFDSLLLLIDLRQAELGELFTQTVNEVFYAQWRAPDTAARNHYPMVALSAQLAEIEALVFTFQKRMLRIMDALVRRLFVDRTERLNETLVESRHLVRVLLLRADACAIEGATIRVHHQRKELFALLRAYDYDSDMVALARKLYAHLDELRARLDQINAEGSAALKRYKYEASFVLGEAQLAAALALVDELLRDAIQRDHAALVAETGTADIEMDQLLERFVGAELVHDIRAAELAAAGRVEQPDQRAVGALDLRQVAAHERDVLNL